MAEVRGARGPSIWRLAAPAPSRVQHTAAAAPSGSQVPAAPAPSRVQRTAVAAPSGSQVLAAPAPSRVQRTAVAAPSGARDPAAPAPSRVQRTAAAAAQTMFRTAPSPPLWWPAHTQQHAALENMPSLTAAVATVQDAGVTRLASERTPRPPLTRTGRGLCHAPVRQAEVGGAREGVLTQTSAAAGRATRCCACRRHAGGPQSRQLLWRGRG